MPNFVASLVEAPNYGFTSIDAPFVTADNVSYGQCCYLDNSQVAHLAKADVVGNCSGILVIANGHGLTGQSVSFRLIGYFNLQGFSLNDTVYLSDLTAGLLVNFAPANPASIVRSCGYASATNVVSFNLLGIGSFPGPTGNPGSAATIAVGTTTTLAAGSSATVTNSGSSSAATFNFGIPKGADGSAGAAGPNNVTTSTSTNITGLFKGNGTNVLQAIPSSDYTIPSDLSAYLPLSGGTLTGALYGTNITLSGMLFAYSVYGANNNLDDGYGNGYIQNLFAVDTLEGTGDSAIWGEYGDGSTYGLVTFGDISSNYSAMTLTIDQSNGWVGINNYGTPSTKLYQNGNAVIQSELVLGIGGSQGFTGIGMLYLNGTDGSAVFADGVAVIDSSGNFTTTSGTFTNPTTGGMIQFSGANGGEVGLYPTSDQNIGFNAIANSGGIIGANAGYGGAAYQMTNSGTYLSYNLNTVSWSNIYGGSNGTMKVGLEKWSPSYTLDVGGTIQGTAIRISGGTANQILLGNGTTNPFFKGTATLVSGTKAVTVSGVTSSNQAFVTLVTPAGTLGAAYKAVCGTNTITITAVSIAGVTVTTDTSTLNYLIL